MFLSEWREFPSVPCLAGKKKLDDCSRLDVVENARVPDMLLSLFPYWSGLRTYQHPSRPQYLLRSLSEIQLIAHESELPRSIKCRWLVTASRISGNE